jgi:hypothetical protein
VSGASQPLLNICTICVQPQGMNMCLCCVGVLAKVWVVFAFALDFDLGSVVFMSVFVLNVCSCSGGGVPRQP